jgi:hypothetical protein
MKKLIGTVDQYHDCFDTDVLRVIIIKILLIILVTLFHQPIGRSHFVNGARNRLPGKNILTCINDFKIVYILYTKVKKFMIIDREPRLEPEACRGF